MWIERPTFVPQPLDVHVHYCGANRMIKLLLIKISQFEKIIMHPGELPLALHSLLLLQQRDLIRKCKWNGSVKVFSVQPKSQLRQFQKHLNVDLLMSIPFIHSLISIFADLTCEWAGDGSELHQMVFSGISLPSRPG